MPFHRASGFETCEVTRSQTSRFSSRWQVTGARVMVSVRTHSRCEAHCWITWRAVEVQKVRPAAMRVPSGGSIRSSEGGFSLCHAMVRSDGSEGMRGGELRRK